MCLMLQPPLFIMFDGQILNQSQFFMVKPPFVTNLSAFPLVIHLHFNPWSPFWLQPLPGRVANAWAPYAPSARERAWDAWWQVGTPLDGIAIEIVDLP